MASEAETALFSCRKTLSIKEALSLADRLESCATSTVLSGQPALCGDIALAVQAIRGMSRSFQMCDVVKIGA